MVGLWSDAPMPPSNNDIYRHVPIDYGVIAKGI
jgi:hypothetical protein